MSRFDFSEADIAAMQEPQPSRETISVCGAYRLVAAIFGQDPQRLLRKKGLLASKRRCRGCGKDMEGEPKHYCPACRLIPIACDWCGQVILRRRAKVLSGAARQGQQQQFCDQLCHGKWLAAHFGFQKGHKNRLNYRKWDREMVWAEHLRTGWGARRLSRLFNIPEGTLTFILRAKRNAH